jgi:hypothetical protein
MKRLILSSCAIAVSMLSPVYALENQPSAEMSESSALTAEPYRNSGFNNTPKLKLEQVADSIQLNRRGPYLELPSTYDAEPGPALPHRNRILLVLPQRTN